ncbi:MULTISPECIES: hypothetical protein, partial [unclassified Streptomyces]|uniref:hypothetical protein n=1 Tax=unclassified Streptomyces TaxID=2593676 RepID=UPI001F350B62
PKWTGYQLLALIFGTLLSSQGTDASFVLTPATFAGAFLRAFVLFLRFQLYQIISAPFPAVDLNSVTVGGLCLSAFHHISAYPLRLIIEPLARNSGMPNKTPPGVSRR